MCGLKSICLPRFIYQWEFQDPKMEVPTIYKAYVREYHHKIWPYMVQYLHFRILKFPLIYIYIYLSLSLSWLVSTSPTRLSQAFVRKLLVQLLESTTTNAKAPMRQRCEHIFNQHRSLVAVGSGKTSGETMGNHYLWGINMFYRCGTDNMVNNKYNIQPIDFPMFSNQYNDGNKWVTTIY